MSGMASSRLEDEALAWRDEKQPITLTGFMLPIDQDGDRVYEFMLVPWAGACSHSAPPHQPTGACVSEEPFHYEVVTVTGTLRPGMDKAQLFVLDGVQVLYYGCSMSHAHVVKGILAADLLSFSPFGILPR